MMKKYFRLPGMKVYPVPEDKIDEVFKEIIQSRIGQPCILCNKPADNAGLFIPNNSQEFGAPINKTRHIAYPICNECLTHNNTPEKAAEKAEAILLKNFSNPTIQ